MVEVSAPLGLLAELTHRCPLRCIYCSNPLELTRASQELSTVEWCRVMEEAAALGIYQIHFSGGEPMVRPDLVEIIRYASAKGLYGNLITSGLLLTKPLLDQLQQAGLEHIQLSIQDSDAEQGDKIAGLNNAHRRKQAAAALIRETGLPLTINAVIHRHNIEHIDDMIILALNCGAQRLEIAHAQYHGWGLKNRATLLPTGQQILMATEKIEAARAKLQGRLQIDYVLPDYFGDQPKACMNGWGQRFIVVAPSGKVLPCHAAETLPDMVFPNIRDHSLADIWQNSDAFNRFRGTGWMPEPCQSCAYKETDWGGCRCQAFALTGNAAATDPACALSADYAILAHSLTETPQEFVYRQF